MSDKAPRIFSVDSSELANSIVDYVIQKGDYDSLLTDNDSRMDYNGILGNLTIDKL